MIIFQLSKITLTSNLLGTCKNSADQHPYYMKYKSEHNNEKSHVQTKGHGSYLKGYS